MHFVRFIAALSAVIFCSLPGAAFGQEYGPVGPAVYQPQAAAPSWSYFAGQQAVARGSEMDYPYPGGMPQFAQPAAYFDPAPMPAGMMDGGMAGPMPMMGGDAGYPVGDPLAGACRSFHEDTKVFWFSTEYLYWRGKGDVVPALATTAPLGTAQNLAGVLGQPTTTVLFGDSGIMDEYRSGGRISGGFWLRGVQAIGVEMDYFALEEETTDFVRESSTTILTRPFFDTTLNIPNALALSFPNYSVTLPNIGTFNVNVAGGIDVHASSDVQSGGIGLRHVLWDAWHCRFDLIGGYRFFRLQEGVQIDDFNSFFVGNVVNQTIATSSFDDFITDNQFHGGDIGLSAEFRRCNWTFDVRAKVALGNNHAKVRINGETTNAVTDAGGNTTITTSSGGLLTGANNIGTFSKDEFTIIPEISIKGGYNFTRNLRATFGYDFMQLNWAVRPAEHIVLQVDPPPFAFHANDFWIHGFNAGLEFRR